MARTPVPAVTAPSLYANYAGYVEQVVQAGVIGSQARIPNPLAVGGAGTAILTDPVQIQAYKVSVADQMNAQSGGPTFVDLADRIADIQTTTVVQGADTLQLSIIDPYRILETAPDRTATRSSRRTRPGTCSRRSRSTFRPAPTATGDCARSAARPISPPRT